MSTSARQSLPEYVEQLKVGGGLWRRLLLQLLFRLTAKGHLRLGMNIQKMRQRQEALDRRMTPVDLSTRRRAAETGDFKAEWVEAMDLRPERVILYLHGGAFMFRFPRTHARMAGQWCKAFNARALMVDYRLAPEHRWPAVFRQAISWSPATQPEATSRWHCCTGSRLQASRCPPARSCCHLLSTSP